MRLAGAAIGVLCVEAGIFRVTLPVICALVLAAADTAWPTRAPSAWLVRRFGDPADRWVAVRGVRAGQAVLAALCAASLGCEVVGADRACWIIAAAVGVLGLAGAFAGRPVVGALVDLGRRGSVTDGRA